MILNNRLIWTAEEGRTADCLSLLDEGAEINARFDGVEGNWTALMSAAFRGKTDTCVALIDRGADIDDANKNGETALVRAAKNQYIETYVALLAHGAKPPSSDSDHASIIHSCAGLVAPVYAEKASSATNTKASIFELPLSRIHYAALLGDIRALCGALDADVDTDLVRRAEEAASMALGVGNQDAFIVLKAWLARSNARSVLEAMASERQPVGSIGP